MKKLFFFSIFFLGIISISQAQVSAGINFQNTRTFITIGTDPDKEFFGEARLGLGRQSVWSWWGHTILSENLMSMLMWE